MISNTVRVAQYVGNNVATVFAISFPFYSNSHIYLYTVDTAGVQVTLTLGTDYTLAGLNNPAGGTATLTVALPSTKTLTIARIVPYQQLTNYINNDAFDSEAHEIRMDLIVQMTQQLAAQSNSLKFPVTEPLSNSTTLPTAFNRKNKLVYFNASTGEMTLLSVNDLATLIAAIIL